MMHSFYLAFKYLKFNKVKTITIVACITTLITLPLSLEILLNESARQLLDRARSTPLLLGAKGSALDLVMNSLYFSEEVTEPITMHAVEDLLSTDMAAPIPLNIRFKARSYPIVGTSFDYFAFRQLTVAQGEFFSMLGQCVIGAEVAQKLNLRPGDHIISSPETLFDIGGIYPLKMKITGILKPSNSADDLGVFVDIKTTWVIQGLGHGHQDLSTSTDESVILKREEGKVTANAKLMQYNEITDENIQSFHLHGDPLAFPLTSVLVVPYTDKSGTILQGRYLEESETLQIFEPFDVISTLMSNIFRIRNVLDSVIFLVGMTTFIALLLIFSLSLRLREKELEVIYKIGCSRTTVTKLLASEILLISITSLLICGGLLIGISTYAQKVVRNIFFS